MKITINKIRRTQKPSKFGNGIWVITEVKSNDLGVDTYQLNGFNAKYAEKLKEGDSLEGFVSEKTRESANGPVITKMFNKITAEYVYNELLKLRASIEVTVGDEPKIVDERVPADPSWDSDQTESEW